MSLVTAFWRRLDTEGHDACRIAKTTHGWEAEGNAVFLHEGKPANLRYAFFCDERWCSRHAAVSGWVGDTEIRLTIERSPSGVWQLNGCEQPVSADLVDIDLGFTPATNTLAIRRLGLEIGTEVSAPAAYLAFPELRLERLEQVYRRIDASRYAYSAPGYQDVLGVSANGVVLTYPGIWSAVG